MLFNFDINTLNDDETLFLPYFDIILQKLFETLM